MAGDRKRRQETETRMTRLGRKAGAVGIHLVLATQQPSRRIVTGPLDANLMARVARKVAREIESQMVIGGGSAATLLGRGDLLFPDIGEPVRLQSPYVPEQELGVLLRT
jgi:DNA segregation ATPase FtsK/SpoIIIE-like protein